MMQNFRTDGNSAILYYQELVGRITKREAGLHALVGGTFQPDRILREVEGAVAKYEGSRERPPLFCLPIGVKDIFRVDGFPTRCGSKLPKELFEGPEAACVSRLKEAGAMVIGKTVTAEFAGPEPGPTCNPHDARHTPGGSSSGSAAGVSAGYFPLALGTQTLGSISRPAAYCGVFGVKPSFGRISTDGIFLFSESADHVGLFFPELSLASLVLEILVDDWDAGSAVREPSLTLGVPTGPYLFQATANELEYFHEAVLTMETAGHTIKEIRCFEDIETLNRSHLDMITREFTRIHSKWYTRYPDLYGPRTAAYFPKGSNINDDASAILAARRYEFRAKVERIMEVHQLDAWVCPSATGAAPRGLDSTGDPIMDIPWTNCGLPTISVPYWNKQDPLPHGLQFVGYFNRDERLLLHVKELSKALTNDVPTPLGTPGPSGQHQSGGSKNCRPLTHGH